MLHICNTISFLEHTHRQKHATAEGNVTILNNNLLAYQRLSGTHRILIKNKIHWSHFTMHTQGRLIKAIESQINQVFVSL